jgi:hypothetical protein
VLIGSGRIIRKEIHLDEFNIVSLLGRGNVFINFSDDFKVFIDTDRNLMNYINVSVENYILSLNFEQREGGFRPTYLTFNVYLPYLKRINILGAGNFTLNEGRTNDLDIRLTGVGSVYAFYHEVNNLNIILSGRGNVNVRVNNRITGQLTGLGHIRFKGNPRVGITHTGIGRIVRV